MTYQFTQRDLELIVKEHIKRIVHDKNFLSKLDEMKIESGIDSSKTECFEISFIEENAPGITRYFK